MTAAGDGSGRPGPVGVIAALVFAALIAGGIWLAVSGGDEASGGPAHIAPRSGSTNGLRPDERKGTPPAEAGPGEDRAGDLGALAAAAGCELREGLPVEGRGHFGPDDPVPAYRTDPPTSGDHIGDPLQQADGAWLDPAAPERVVHSLEHGRIAIQYDPELPTADQLALKGLYDSAYSAALLFPNPEMRWSVAATAWQSLIGCPELRGETTLEAIRAFGAAHQGRGPEPMSGFPPLDGPRFVQER